MSARRLRRRFLAAARYARATQKTYGVADLPQYGRLQAALERRHWRRLGGVGAFPWLP